MQCTRLALYRSQSLVARVTRRRPPSPLPPLSIRSSISPSLLPFLFLDLILPPLVFPRSLPPPPAFVFVRCRNRSGGHRSRASKHKERPKQKEGGRKPIEQKRPTTTQRIGQTRRAGNNNSSLLIAPPSVPRAIDPFTSTSAQNRSGRSRSG